MGNERNKLETLSQFCDFQWKALSNTASILSKGIAFYLAIIAAVTGYILTKQLSCEVKVMAVLAGSITSVIATIAGGSLAWGLNKGLRNLEITLMEMDKELFYKLQLNLFLVRGRRVIWIVSGCAALVLVLCVLCMVFLARY